MIRCLAPANHSKINCLTLQHETKSHLTRIQNNGADAVYREKRKRPSRNKLVSDLRGYLRGHPVNFLMSLFPLALGQTRKSFALKLTLAC
ncbi:hypothetical protein ACFX2G_044137 [Malus domestica]